MARSPEPGRRVLRLVGVLSGLFLAAPALHAHRPYEVTTVGRLQHGRLELTVTFSPVMANYLLRDAVSPESASLDPETFEQHREALLRLAPDFLQLRDGDTLLRPEKILLALNTSREPEFAFVYPLPANSSLRLRAGTLRAPGREGLNVVRFFDDDEKLLGAGLLGPESKTEEITISPSPPPAAPAASTSALP